MSKEAKQVIVMRKDLGMRKGKMIAQGGHAAASWLAGLVREMIETGKAPKLSKFERQWIFERFKKVCVGASSEQELEEIYQKAKNAGLNAVKIIDAGLTEFSGPTFTCVGIGPDDPEEIDKITGHLSLL